MSTAVLLRADAGRDVGMGHFRRCLTLADELSRRGLDCKFACRDGGHEVTDLPRAHGHDVSTIPNEGLEAEARRLAGESDFDCDVLVLDISHVRTFQEDKAVPAAFGALRRRFPVVAIIDGFGEHCLAARHELPADLVIVPYAGARRDDLKGGSARQAIGPAFFMLDPAYSAGKANAREIAPVARNILVTAGGSDPSGLTLKSLEALEMLPFDLAVRVVIGPAFDASLRTVIEAHAAGSRHDVKLLHAPETLADAMFWSDLCISASGLTKYELAATGTPALLLSIDADHEAFDRGFRETGAARHLGIVAEVPARDIAAATGQLIEDAAARGSMSSIGRQLLDGQGTRRVADAIIEMRDAAVPRRQRANAGKII